MLDFFLNKQIKKHYKTIEEINRIYNKLKNLPDDLLKKQTSRLKIGIRNKKFNLDYILPEAFATTKVAIARATGIILFDVQLLGGIYLHDGNITEMKTGEGKTLSALLPAYLNSLESRGVHVITINDYLAQRDAKLAQEVFEYLQTTIGLVTQSTEYRQRREEYKQDITYVTNSELGFDYLRDNMATYRYDIVQRQLHYAIIDEVDSILIDEARTPLIISGTVKQENTLYQEAQKITNILTNKSEYKVDEKSKSIILTEQGILLCEKKLKIKNLYDTNSPWLKYIINALKAKELFIKNKDYIIKNQKVVIVDEFTGRIMDGRRWSDGIHQAIEAKEQLSIEKENRTLASITYQNLFLLYKKLCGMTGTAKTEENEFLNIYKTSVVGVPTNKKCIRKDLPDLVYRLEYHKWQAIAKECFDMYAIGRPTLIGTTSIEKSELLANMLNLLEIPHNLLNARPENIKREAEIIAEAGIRNSITISTNMAGRGTDIILGGKPDKIIQSTIKKEIFNIGTTLTFLNHSDYYSIYNVLNKSEIDQIYKFISDKIANQQKIEDVIDRLLYHNEGKKFESISRKLSNEYLRICNKEKQEILNLGGLYVIGTERHESRRIDNQLRGRSGRQGDKGSSRFFLSLQDNLFKIFGGSSIEKLMSNLKIKDERPIESVILSKSLDNAQQKVEAYFYDIRKQLFEYDEVINNQRKSIYKERIKILSSAFTRDCIIEYGEYTINEMLKIYNKSKYDENLLSQVFQLINVKKHLSEQEVRKMNLYEVQHFLHEQFRVSYDLKETYLEQLRPGLIRQLEKYYLLQQIDKGWQDHIEKMGLLKEYIGWRSYGQQDPLIEYKNEGFNLFVNMITYIRQTVIYLIMRSRLIIDIDN